MPVIVGERVADPGSQRAAVLPAQRGGDLLDVRQRLSDFVVPGDHGAIWIKNAEAGQCDPLGLVQDGLQSDTDVGVGRIRRRRRWAGIRPPRQKIVAGKIERGPDRRKTVCRLRLRGRWKLRAERDIGRTLGLDFPRENHREHPALRDQFGLGLMNELVVVDAEKEQTAERQRNRGRQHGKHDKAERGPPLVRDRRRTHARGSQRPSLNPTPCTVSMTLSQPAAASLALIFLMWLSMVRSETWIFIW